MAQLNFDAATVDPTPSRQSLPTGWYTAKIVNSEMKPTSKGDGSYLALTLEVLDGPRPGAKLFTNLNLENTNPVAVEIAYKTLSSICHATGVIKLAASEQLHGIPMAVRVLLKPAQGNYDESNDLKEFRKYGEAPQAPPNAPMVAQANGFAAPPAWATPAPQAQAPQGFAPAPAPVPPAPVYSPAPVAQPFQAAQVPVAPAQQWAPAPAPAPQAAAPVQQAPPPASDQSHLPPWERK